MPVDGVITDGVSELDRSLLTGETLPVFAEPGRDVSAGEVNLTGPLTVRATAVGEQTSLHRMADLVAMAETSRNKYTSLADQAAKIYAPAVHLLALAAFIAWMFISGWDVRLSLNIAVATLIITCPCALGLAVPAVGVAATSRMRPASWLALERPVSGSRHVEKDDTAERLIDMPARRPAGPAGQGQIHDRSQPTR